MEVVEYSTLIIRATFKDDLGVAVIPNSIRYTLYNKLGEVMNSLLNVVITPPALSVDVVLKGADLSAPTGDLERILVVDAPYDSTSGSGLNNRQIYEFTILKVGG